MRRTKITAVMSLHFSISLAGAGRWGAIFMNELCAEQEGKDSCPCPAMELFTRTMSAVAVGLMPYLL